MTNYIDPFAQLFCVRFNYSPKMDFYWADKTELSPSEVAELRSDEDKSGFYSTFIGPADSSITRPNKAFYLQGERMYSEICLTDAKTNCKP